MRSEFSKHSKAKRAVDNTYAISRPEFTELNADVVDQMPVQTLILLTLWVGLPTLWTLSRPKPKNRGRIQISTLIHAQLMITLSQDMPHTDGVTFVYDNCNL